jgi:hypothetical protein
VSAGRCAGDDLPCKAAISIPWEIGWRPGTGAPLATNTVFAGFLNPAITAMSLVHLEFEALKILITLEDMNSDKVAIAIAAARALADALADAAEASDSAAEIAA